MTYDGDDLAEYVIDAPRSTPHVDRGASDEYRKWCYRRTGAEIAGGGSDGRVLSKISEKSSGEREALRQAGVVFDYTPDLAEQVVAGDITLNAAY